MEFVKFKKLTYLKPSLLHYLPMPLLVRAPFLASSLQIISLGNFIILGHVPNTMNIIRMVNASTNMLGE